jgi:RNaseH domain of pPIWI_RE
MGRTSLIRPRQRCIMGKTSEMSDWVPYPELLRGLAGSIRLDDLKTEEQQVTAAATFIWNTLYRQRGEPTLVVTHAQNTRYRWPWLKNSGLVQDRIQIGGGPLQRLAVLGKQLRVARVATGDRDETPEWWAPKPDQRGGLAKGLWVPADSDETNRVFYSTTGKASTHPISVDATKLTPHLDAAGEPRISPGKNAWNPELLEFTMVCLQPQDDPEQWAMYLHQQRFSDDYRDSLGLPLILHLAELTSHYALPHEEVEQLRTETDAGITAQSDLLTDSPEEPSDL